MEIPSEEALQNYCTVPEEVPINGKRFWVGIYSYTLAFHVGQT